MPHINLYVKNDDWAAYEAIKDKPKWLHKAIAGTIEEEPTHEFKPVGITPPIRPSTAPSSSDNIHDTTVVPIDEMP